MAYDICKSCGWDFPAPELADTIRGKQICAECETDRPLSDFEKDECANELEMRLARIEELLAI